jgi:hypothetical protein
MMWLHVCDAIVCVGLPARRCRFEDWAQVFPLCLVRSCYSVVSCFPDERSRPNLAPRLWHRALYYTDAMLSSKSEYDMLPDTVQSSLQIHSISQCYGWMRVVIFCVITARNKGDCEVETRTRKPTTFEKTVGPVCLMMDSANAMNLETVRAQERPMPPEQGRLQRCSTVPSTGREALDGWLASWQPIPC